MAGRGCVVFDRKLKYTVFAWFSSLPTCQKCGAAFTEGDLGFWCTEKLWIRCESCERDTRTWLERHEGKCMVSDEIHIGRPVWVNVERGVMNEESGENEGSG